MTFLVSVFNCFFGVCKSSIPIKEKCWQSKSSWSFQIQQDYKIRIWSLDADYHILKEGTMNAGDLVEVSLYHFPISFANVDSYS